MARKTISRLDKRREVEAAEKSGGEGAAGKTDAKKKAAKKTAKPAKRKSRSKKKSDEPVRLKAFWGVYNQSLKQVARFEYHERKQAQKKAEEMSTSQKTPHFVRPVKEEIVEE